MDKTKLTWDDSALERDSADITFTVKPAKGKEPNKETVTFYELSRTMLSNYLRDMENVDTSKPDTTEADKRVSKELTQVSDETLPIVFKYLSISTDGVKKPEWFEGLELTSSATARLLGFMHQLNHVEEILMSQGNWAALPGIMAMMAGQNQEKPASD
jgi:hypothetical protein